VAVDLLFWIGWNLLLWLLMVTVKSFQVTLSKLLAMLGELLVSFHKHPEISSRRCEDGNLQRLVSKVDFPCLNFPCLNFLLLDYS
jgi:hypothetical protein